jgi:acetyl-CoA carboxylase biotin carboxyl carrier protein
MDLNLIKKLVRIVDTSEITDLEVEENGLRIKVAKKIRSYRQDGLQHVVFGQPPVTEQPAVRSAIQEISTSTLENQTNFHEIKSPIVGTFYRAPAPDADAYVNVGDTVSSGSVLCIIEAMKLMNEIESDISGKIVKILVENGRPVEYNQPLFLIQSS